jgi:FAD/FMN-containing dehydrogenase
MVHDLVTAAGGSLSAEHGHRPDEACRVRAPGAGRAASSALRAIKRALDPKA